jgi:ribosomal protein S18 acetylase RimI-like enzyme
VQQDLGSAVLVVRDDDKAAALLVDKFGFSFLKTISRDPRQALGRRDAAGNDRPGTCTTR